MNGLMRQEKRREPREHKDSKSPPKRKASRHKANGTSKYGFFVVLSFYVSNEMTRRAKTARWNSDQSESEEEPSSDDSEQEDREETPAKASSEREDGQESDDEDENQKKTERSRKPSRKAGTRAKVCCFVVYLV